MNPYEPLTTFEPLERSVAYRTGVTFVHAVVIGAAVAAICPAFIAGTWFLRSMHSNTEILDYLAETFVGPSLLGIGVGLLCGLLAPDRLSRLLSRVRHSLPLMVNATLFSLMFTLLGFGFLNDSLSFFGQRLSVVALSNAAIVAVVVFLHLACRPQRKTQ